VIYGTSGGIFYLPASGNDDLPADLTKRNRGLPCVAVCSFVVALVNEKPTLRFAWEGADLLTLSPDLDSVCTTPDLNYPFRPEVGNTVSPALEGY